MKGSDEEGAWEEAGRRGAKTRAVALEKGSLIWNQEVRAEGGERDDSVF